MEFYLRVKVVGQQAAFTVIDSDTGFITGGFHTENEHLEGL
jgi:hypothetical protein